MIIERANIIEIIYRIMIYNMSKYDIDFEKNKSEEIITQIQDFNSEKITIERIESLLKQSRNSNALIQLIIISFKYSKETNDCIEMEIHIKNHHYATTERYIPQSQIKQCFKCHAYKYKANVCIRKVRYGKCA